jgi:hypothetical protein
MPNVRFYIVSFEMRHAAGMFYGGWNSEQALERQNLTMLVRFLTLAPEGPGRSSALDQTLTLNRRKVRILAKNPGSSHGKTVSPDTGA